MIEEESALTEVEPMMYLHVRVFPHQAAQAKKFDIALEHLINTILWNKLNRVKPFGSYSPSDLFETRLTIKGR